MRKKKRTWKPSPREAAMRPEALRRIRDALGLTQTALAEAIGVKSLAVSRWENGEVPISKGRALAIQALAAARGVA